MHLTKLEIKGFKSFAQRSVLHFEKGVTAVVGPNGCGKSNVADAIRWVLGEQSARSLRGQKMEDIIFSGTDRKKPQGLAEVTIVFDNHSGEFPLPYKEVAITRRVFRSGESEYLINNHRCRLKDVRELLMDTGIGKEGYSIIGQGRIDELLSQKGEERRLLFDEAAGIVKYRVRKEEAEKKMSRTEENLSRLQDIIIELDDQMEPLRNQAKKAEKFLELREKVNYLDIESLVKDHKKLNDQLLTMQEEKNNLQQYIEEISQEQEALLLSKQQLEVEEIQYLSEKDSHETTCGQLKEHKEELRTKMMLYRQKQEHLAEKVQLLSQEVKVVEAELIVEENRLADLKNNQQQHHEDKCDTIGVINGLKDQATRLEEQLNLRQTALEEKKAGVIETLNKISVLKARKERLKAMIEAAEDRGNQLESEYLSITKEQDLLEDQQKGHSIQLSESRERIEGIQVLSNELEAKRNLNEKEIEATSRNVYQLTKELDQAVHRKNLLISMEDSFEGFHRGVKNVLRAVQQKTEMAEGFHGVVADLLRVPRGYELAVETALGAALQYIVTDNEHQGKGLIDYLKKQHLGRITVLPLRVIKGKNLRNNELKILENHPGASCALDVISYPSPYKQIFESLLGRVIIADNLDTAIKIARDFNHQIKITTIEGDLIQPGGSMSGGSSSSQPDGLLVRKREIEELGKSIHEIEAKRKVLELRLQQMIQRNKHHVDTISANNEEISRIQEQCVRLDSTMESIQNQIKDKKYRRQLVSDEKKQLFCHRQGLLGEMDTLEDELRSLEDELINVQEMTQKELTDQDSIKEEFSRLQHELNLRQIKLAEKMEQERSISNELAMINNLVHKSMSRVESLNHEINSHNKMQIELHQRVLENEKRYNDNEFELSALIKIINEIAQKLKHSRSKIKETMLEQERVTQKTNEMKDSVHQCDIKISKIDWQLQQVTEKLMETHELNPLQAKIWLRNNARDDVKVTELGSLRREMELLGHVHIGALEEYNRVRERYQFLLQQQNDLLESKESLKNIITQLEDHMVRQFKEQFDKIQVTFKDVFQKLFNGGSTELILQTPEDLLSSGIEIMVQPPGKKSQHLSLLSGGEKALTAISLLFGILLVKPSPFCVLDEIEAALDDANVSRFADYLISLSDAIQFVVVTHKKQTMERAGTLYGITMQEKGISKLLTLRFQDIDETMIAG